MTDIRVGTCGYQYYDPPAGWKDDYESKLAAYSDAYAVGELNRTFYELPRVSTAERWRREAVEGFGFTLKAWQGLTHPWASPTWNDHRDAVDDVDTDDLGLLHPPTPSGTPGGRPGRGPRRSRPRSSSCRRRPASTAPTPTRPTGGVALEHRPRRPDAGLGTPRRLARASGPDPRGLHRPRTRPRRRCDAGRASAGPRVCYTRLHGLNEDRNDYEYEYGNDELDDLAERFRDQVESHDRVYCLFNNDTIDDNARALGARLSDGPGP